MMKRLFLFSAFFAVVTRAAQIGESYGQIIAEKGAPKSKMGAGANLILNYEDATIKLREGKVVAITAILPVALKPEATPGEVSVPKPSITSLKFQELKAVGRVKQIINQPAETITVPTGTRIYYYPTWFHDGASIPDFANVDLRQTQESPYDNFEYVASSKTPSLVYRGKSLEFNSATKLFYVDRSVPKKRLTEPEMVELNRLYRIIADCEIQLHTLKSPATVW